MRSYQLIKKACINPHYLGMYARKCIHAFDFFGIDYKFFSGYSLPPKSVCFILTEMCNLQCKMCDIGQRNSNRAKRNLSPLVDSIVSGKEKMSLDDWTGLVEELGRFIPKPLILLTGTEPLLYKNVLNLIEAITKQDLPLHITTNGTLLSKFANALVGLSQRPHTLDITVSIDGIGQCHDTIRGVQGTFDKAIQGIRDVLGARQKNNKDFPPVNITCTISPYNYKNLEYLTEWFFKEKIAIESLTFNHLWFKDDSIVTKHNKYFGDTFPVKRENVANIDLTSCNMKIIYKQIQSIKKRFAHAPFRIYQYPDLSFKDALIYYRDPCKFVFYNRCTAPWRNITINPKGNVILSPMCFLPSLGNVKEKSFFQLWNGDGFRALRNNLKQQGAFPACARCCMLFDSKPKYYKIKSWVL